MMAMASVTADAKKQIVINLRPLQLKIEDIVNFSETTDSIEHNIEVSDDESDPIIELKRDTPG